MVKLSTAAWVGHNLGLAAWFGGTLFGKLALNPSVRAISSREERGKVLNAAWNRYIYDTDVEGLKRASG